jgi:deazaflavin-dependent oxidoreductase (nitroreductase family)
MTTLTAALADSREVDITTVGRRTGREHTNPVWFVRAGESVYLLPVGGSGSNWYKNLIRNPTVRLGTGGQTVAATARPITDAAAVDHVVDDFRRRYGADPVDNYYPGVDVAVEVKPR